MEELQRRVESLEGLQRVAQETALASEQRLEELEAALQEATEQRDTAVQKVAVLQQETAQQQHGGEGGKSPATLPDVLQVSGGHLAPTWVSTGVAVVFLLKDGAWLLTYFVS